MIHFAPGRNWINDPNGCVYFGGYYHLHYQYHPHGTPWGPMHWGHAVSRNLLDWEEKDIALYPDDRTGMAFSYTEGVHREHRRSRHQGLISLSGCRFPPAASVAPVLTGGRMPVSYPCYPDSCL